MESYSSKKMVIKNYIDLISKLYAKKIKAAKGRGYVTLESGNRNRKDFIGNGS